MRIMSSCDQKVWIEKIFLARMNVIDSHRVHMMDKDLVMDLMPLDTEVTTVISHDNVVSELSPLPRSVESLVQPPVVAKSRDPDSSTKSEVPKSFFKRFYTTQFVVISSNHRLTLPESGPAQRKNA